MQGCQKGHSVQQKDIELNGQTDLKEMDTNALTNSSKKDEEDHHGKISRPDDTSEMVSTTKKDDK